MKYKSFSVYDDDDFFNQYITKRSKGRSPNELLEEPIMDELIGGVADKQILDLGCGDGKYGAKLLGRGAKYYHGIEGSQNMADLARIHLDDLNATVELGDIEAAAFGTSSYDMVVSRLVLHYIEDLESLLDKINLCLRPGGEFVFSIEHPVITSCYDAYHEKVKRGNWIVDDYFNSGERVNVWIGKEVVKYHKPLEEYWRIVKKMNFDVVELRESKPDQVNFVDHTEFERRKRIPLFLFFKLKKQV